MPAAGRSLQREALDPRCSMPRGRVVLKVGADVAVLDGLPYRWRARGSARWPPDRRRGGRGARCRRTHEATRLEAPAPPPARASRSSHSFIPRAIAYAARNEVGAVLFAQARSLRFFWGGRFSFLCGCPVLTSRGLPCQRQAPPLSLTSQVVRF
jgi:hypothetical protein